MIETFTNTMQRDFIYVMEVFRGRVLSQTESQVKERNARLALCAIRAFAFLGIAFSAIMALKALTNIISSVFSVLFYSVTSIIAFILNHDVFIMAKNGTEMMTEQGETLATFRTVYSTIAGLFVGQPPVDEAARQNPLTQGTYLNPIWNYLLDEFSTRKG